MKKQFIAYARTSTREQCLGIEAQKTSAKRYVEQNNGDLIAVYAEQESGGKNERPELIKAMLHAEKIGATLVIVRVDRLSRNAAFLLQIRDRMEKTGLKITAIDMPDLFNNFLVLCVVAGMCQQEKEYLRQRTREALAVKKAQGVKLGRQKGCDLSLATQAATKKRMKTAQEWALSVSPIIVAMKKGGTSLTDIADALNRQGILTRRGCLWNTTTVKRVLSRVSE